MQTTGQAGLTLSGGSSLLAGTARLEQGTGGARSRRGTNETYAPRGAEPTLQRSVLTECTHNSRLSVGALCHGVTWLAVPMGTKYCSLKAVVFV